jgi:hypothetical protein
MLKAKSFIDEANRKYFERMAENEKLSLLNQYPALADGLAAIPQMDGKDFDEVKYCIQSALVEATEEFVVGSIVDLEESDHGYESDASLYWEDENSYNGEPYVTMRIKSLTRIYADYPLSAFHDEKKMETLLNETHAAAMDHYQNNN